MRVLLAIDSLGVGGKERQAVELIKGLACIQGVDSRVVCFGSEDFYVSDLEKARISVDFVVRRARWDLRVFQTMRRLIGVHRPDVIHTNGLVSSFYCLPLAKERGIPLLNGSIRNAFTEDGVRWTIERLLLKMSDYRISNSHAGLRSRRLSESDPRNRVIYNGFDFSRLRHVGRAAVHVNPESGERTATATVGMVAEFSPYKDYRTFIEAARIVRSRHASVRFTLVGDGATRKQCQALAEGLDGVCFAGQRKDVLDVISTFDVGVLCTFTEGLSNSVMEYMALGKPVVATGGGGTPELVIHGETGFVVETSSASAVADAVSCLLERPDVAKRMGAAGRARLERNFSLTTMIGSTLELYGHAARRN